jgi:phosphate-selective porin OprO/OprP
MRSRKSTVRTRWLVAASMSVIATAAHGQAQPDPRDAEIQELKAEVHALAVKLDQLEARANTPPVIETPAQAPAAPAVVSLAAGRPSIASNDGQFTANLHAVMNFDAAQYNQASAGPIATDLRRGAAKVGP